MLITCDGCSAKIRVPDSAAGKRVKCPKCAHVITVPAANQSKADLDAEDTKVSEKRLPPPPPIDDEPLGDEEKTKVTSSGAKPPKIKPKPARANDDEDAEDVEDDRPKRKRRRLDEDENDYLDVRSGRGGRANNMATTSMTLGIISLVMATLGGCCCGVIGAIVAIICGGLALTFGFMGRGPGSDSTAMTGIICGGIGLALGLIVLILGIFWIGFNLAGGPQQMFNFPKG